MNKLLARKLRFAAYLLIAFGLLYAMLRRPDISAELRPQLEAVQWLLLMLAAITVAVAVIFNPWREDRVPDRFPAIVQDALVIAIFLITATFIFPDRLLATSAVGAVVIGFALQDTLGNAFSGLAIQIEKPFRVGHWISVGAFEGRVSEITWRATRLRTKSGNFVIVPNSVMSKEAITNYSEPASPTRLFVDVGASYDVPPTRVKAVMLDAVRQSPLAIADPAPAVALMDFAASSITYRAYFWVNDFRQDTEACDQVRTSIYYAFKRQGIEIPYPIQVEYSREEAVRDEGRERLGRAAALACVPMFVELTEEERALLASAAIERVFGAGERMVRQGETGESMFVLLDGIARVTVEPDTEVAQIRSGGCFGEMSLLTGEPRTATVSARTDCTVLEIAPDAFNRIAQSNPAAMQRVAALAAERRGPLEQARLAAIAAGQNPPQRGLLARMRRWVSPA